MLDAGAVLSNADVQDKNNNTNMSEWVPLGQTVLTARDLALLEYREQTVLTAEQGLYCTVQYSFDLTANDLTIYRDIYLEQQKTEKIETEMKDVDRIQIRKVYACCPGWHSGKSPPVSHKYMLSHPSFSSPLINEDLPAGPQLVFTLNNRFFRHQACYSLLPAKPGGQADRVVSLYKYKVVGINSPVLEFLNNLWGLGTE